MNWLKRLVGCAPAKDTLKLFGGHTIRVEWQRGNNLKITFLEDCYVRRQDTLTIRAPLTVLEVTPGVVYDSGVKSDV